MDSLDELLRRLKNTNSSGERNALAITATETGDLEVKKVLIEMIDRPELLNERGTFVNCLGQFDCSRNFLFLVRLVCEGNWEVSHEAADILAKNDLVEGREVKEGYNCLRTTVAAGVNDEWRAELIADLLSMFD
ncbi:hypothetical protein [Massilia scottii]|uniref:hypothetical protein n=1 Tax=Massilia scottii TaxID=3057166 RepID=UPI00279651C3|nr:hypothetical protein [Massilia sp. CCM 9029]MDQ1833762.1 hypothetical protein [Massilia sp. CCM 9029]